MVSSSRFLLGNTDDKIKRMFKPWKWTHMQRGAVTHCTNPSNWFYCLEKWAVSWKLHMIRIHLNSRSLYLLVSSPMLSSLLFSSSHALSAYREMSPPFPVSQSFLLWCADLLASDVTEMFFSPSLSYSSSATRVAGQHRGKGGLKGWRKQGGVDLWDIGRQFAGIGFLTFIWKCFHRTDQKKL